MRTITWRSRLASVWQRHDRRWRRTCWTALLVALACGLGALAVLWPTVPVWGKTARPSQNTPAQAMAQGLAAFQRGDLEGAATRWQEAVRLATDAKQPHTAGSALTHLARAYEALGYYERSVHSLQTALPLAAEASDHTQRALILGSLGNLAVTAGNLTEAERLVHDALALARDLNNPGLTATLLHTRGALLLAQQRPQEAIEVYRTSAAQAQRAQQHGIAARALAHAARAAEVTAQPQTARTLLDNALTLLRQAESSHETAYELLFVGRAYHRLAATDPALVLRAAEIFTQAADLAQTLGNVRALSYALGYLGRLYEEERRYQEALHLTRRASQAIQHVYAPETLYLWQWQSGRLLRALDDMPAAIAAYERALATVQEMRAELWRGVGQTATSFRASLGPLYFELADLFLRQATALEAQQETRSPQYARYLHQARGTIEHFKTAELRDYFGDECVAAVQPSRTALEHVSPEAVIVYPIILPERTEILASFPTGLQRLTIPVPSVEIEQRVRIFRHAVEERDPFRYLQHAQVLYTWFIRPLEAAMAAQHLRTLVLVPDGVLRLLPLAALHDGQQFLIEKYALAVTPSLTLTEPRPLPQGKVQALAAGVSGAMEGFPSLPRVAEELRNLQRLYGGTILLDQGFSPESLDTALRQGAFGIVHIASHGHFAAEAAQSFLLTAQGKLTLPHLAHIVGRLRFREQPIEILTLSACDTARGDDRAALGLAGVAIQAGARSALATLWLVADEAAAVVMTAFYQHLQKPGVSRARALQQAQLTLLKESKYAEPFFWAPFLLINNWL